MDTSDPVKIWEYLAQIKEDRRPLDEAKVLVVGEGSVGKTSLIRRPESLI
jgi:internalin A